jgi:hypothetical protein
MSNYLTNIYQTLRDHTLGNTGNISIADTGRFWKILVIQYCRYWKILENTGNTSIADTGKYWLYQVSVPVLQILEDTGKILVLPVLCTSIVVPVSRPAASYYPLNCPFQERHFTVVLIS